MGERATGSSYRWVIEGALLLMQVGIGINFMAPAPLFPMIMDEYALSRTSVSLLVAVVTLGIALLTLPAGVIASKVGLAKSYAIGGLLMSAGLLAPLAPSFYALLALRVCYAIGAGVIIPVTSAVVMQWFKPRELTMVNSLNLTGQSIGVATSMYIGVPLAEAMGWRFPLLVYGAVALAATGGWALFGMRPAPTAQALASSSLRDLLGVLKERTTLLLMLAGIGPFALFVALTSWLPTYYNEALGMSLTKASFIVGLLPLVGIPATILGGVVPARLGLRRPFLIVPGVLLPLAAAACFLFTNMAVIYIGVVVLGIMAWVYLPVLFTIPMEMAGASPGKVAVITAATLAVGDLGSFVSPIMVGRTTDVLGSYLPGFSVLAVLSSTLLIAGILLPETGPRAARARAALRPVDTPEGPPR